MNGILLAIAAPLVGALGSLLPLSRRGRVGLALGSGALLGVGALRAFLAGRESVVLSGTTIGLAQNGEILADFLLLLYLLWVAWDRRSPWAAITGILNIGLYSLAITTPAAPTRVLLQADGLARFFLLVVAVVAPAIWVWAPYYHEHHDRAVPAFAPRPYYFWLFAIVAVMNALFTVNNLLDLYLLWELTTLPPFC